MGGDPPRESPGCTVTIRIGAVAGSGVGNGAGAAGPSAGPVAGPGGAALVTGDSADAGDVGPFDGITDGWLDAVGAAVVVPVGFAGAGVVVPAGVVAGASPASGAGPVVGDGSGSAVGAADSVTAVSDPDAEPVPGAGSGQSMVNEPSGRGTPTAGLTDGSTVGSTEGLTEGPTAEPVARPPDEPPADIEAEETAPAAGAMAGAAQAAVPAISEAPTAASTSRAIVAGAIRGSSRRARRPGRPGRRASSPKPRTTTAQPAISHASSPAVVSRIVCIAASGSPIAWSRGSPVRAVQASAGPGSWVSSTPRVTTQARRVSRADAAGAASRSRSRSLARESQRLMPFDMIGSESDDLEVCQGRSSTIDVGLTRPAGRCEGGAMRWERLFAELEGRFDVLADEQAEQERADRERVAIGAVTAVERLSGALDHQVRLGLAGGALVAGRLGAVGPDWLLLVEGQDRDCIVPWRSVTVVHGLTSATGPAPSGLDLRLDLRYALRGLARDRAPVQLGLVGWAGGEAAVAGPSPELTGTIDRVGADFVEVALHAAWESRRRAAVRSVALVPLAAVLLVRATPLG